MDAFYSFASANPWLTALLAYLPVWLILRLVRAAVIMAKGWPPPHLDADGESV